ncbi:acyl carrier protein [Microlunatus parietis]|uniref:Acyl carrier protein n=1 Tax=Microlunatus parietis TaxID=682979 RepID=A0A7Y9LDS7_9ACTN|nr:phosphopantetheine-binding protein [Microlunatus parietis]NYE73110.1 acyl carrier protein [Microlunatus parietis]
MTNETVVTTTGLTDDDLRQLLLAVGLDAATAVPESYQRSFTDLDLDSLARVEIASRIQDQFGVEIEPDLTAEATPAGIRDLVNDRLAGRA